MKARLALLGFLALATGVLLMPATIRLASGQLGQALWDLGHLVIGIGLAMTLSYQRELKVLRPGALWWRVLIVITLLAAGFEGLQSFLQRSPSLQDVLVTVSGAVLFLWWHAGLPCRHRWRLPVATLTGGALLAVFYPFFWTIAAALEAHWRFPVLADFESPLFRGQWASGWVVRVPDPEDPSNWMGQLSGSPGPNDRRQWRGVRFADFPQDWRGHAVLALDIYASRPGRLKIRIDDQFFRRLGTYRAEDRVSLSPTLKAGWNRLRYVGDEWQMTPSGRRLDLQAIEQLHFTITQLQPGLWFGIDNVRLQSEDAP